MSAGARHPYDPAPLQSRSIEPDAGNAISDLIDELFPLLKTIAERAGGDLSLDVQSALPDVMVDTLRIQHAVLTLVQNAFEASDPASLVEARRLTGDRYGVEISVLDRGHGIPENARGSHLSSVLHDQGPRHRSRAGVDPRDCRSSRRNDRLSGRSGRRSEVLVQTAGGLMKDA